MDKSLINIIGEELYNSIDNLVNRAYLKSVSIKEFDEEYTYYLNQLIKKGNVPDSVISTMNKIYIDVRMHYESNK